MITITVNNATEPDVRDALQTIIDGEFHYTTGTQIDETTFEIEFENSGGYAVAVDDMRDERDTELVEQEPEGFTKLMKYIPRTINVEEGDSITVNL
jgi:hypothetical protein